MLKTCSVYAVVRSGFSAGVLLAAGRREALGIPGLMAVGVALPILDMP